MCDEDAEFLSMWESRLCALEQAAAEREKMMSEAEGCLEEKHLDLQAKEARLNEIGERLDKREADLREDGGSQILDATSINEDDGESEQNDCDNDSIDSEQQQWESLQRHARWLQGCPTVEDREARLEERYKEFGMMVNEHEAVVHEISHREEELRQRELQLMSTERKLQLWEANLRRNRRSSDSSLGLLDQKLLKRENTLAKKEKSLLEREKLMNEQKETLSSRESMLTDREQELNNRDCQLTKVWYVLDEKRMWRDMISKPGVPYKYPPIDELDEEPNLSNHDLQGEYDLIYYYNEIAACCDSEFLRHRTVRGSMTITGVTADEDKGITLRAHIQRGEKLHYYAGPDQFDITEFGGPRKCWQARKPLEGFVSIVPNKWFLPFSPDYGLRNASTLAPQNLPDAEHAIRNYQDAQTSWLCRHMGVSPDVAFCIRQYLCPPPVLFLEKNDLCISMVEEDGCGGEVIFARKRAVSDYSQKEQNSMETNDLLHFLLDSHTDTLSPLL